MDGWWEEGGGGGRSEGCSTGSEGRTDGMRESWRDSQIEGRRREDRRGGRMEEGRGRWSDEEGSGLPRFWTLSCNEKGGRGERTTPSFGNTISSHSNARS